MLFKTKIILMSVCILVVAACSFKTFYNRLDYLIPSYIEGLVSLDDVLEKKVEQRSELLINWHRRSQLKQYADWLRSLQHDLNSGLTELKCEQHIAILESFWYSILVRINEEMIILLPSLTSEQRKELFESIKEKNEDYKIENVELSNDARLERNSQRMVDQYESWFGELTDDQVKAIQLAATELKSTAELRLQQRLVWQQGIQSIIDTTGFSEQKSQRLRNFLDNYEINKNPGLKTMTQFNSKIIVKLTIQLIHDLSLDQKESFMNKTDEYIRVFTELAENR